MQGVFITGGTSGIGLELARHYLRLGAHVAVAARDQKKFDETLKDEKNAHFYQLDVASYEELKSAVDDFTKSHRLDLMVANAGMAMGDKRGIPNLQRDLKLVDVNIKGVMYCIHLAIEKMREQEALNGKRGHIVAIGSLAGFNGLPGTCSYSASKAWVEKYCESLHLDLKKYQIVVTSICPGFIRTPFTANNKHKMPFLMETDQAGREIIKAIEKEKVRHVFPKTLGSVALLLSYLPRRIYSKVIKVYSPDSDYKKA